MPPMRRRSARRSLGQRLRFVPVKTVEQQAALMLHRSRDLLIRQRTQLINALRAHLAELGLVAPTGVVLEARVFDTMA